MKRTVGRCVYITDISRVVGRTGAAEFAAKCRDAHLDAIWIRAGRGAGRDPNIGFGKLAAIRAELSRIGIELWGWHVPFCADTTAAGKEAAAVLSWAAGAQLAGIIVDAERTPESPRFRGDVKEAVAYLKPLTKGLEAAGLGLAFSSHDQPSVHTDMPFAPFLDFIEDVCPQVYYTNADPGTRLRKSIRDYKCLIPPADFASRYKPTGNITVGDDVPLPDAPTCLKATGKFLDLVKSNGLSSCSFWCWDSAPSEIWDFLARTAVPETSFAKLTLGGMDMNLDAAQLKLNIVQDYVPVGNSNRPGTKLAASSITIHNTDNTSKGANAAAHARYMKGPDAQKRQVSWHFTVDDGYVYQSLPTNEIGWHAGNKQGNASSIGLEICMNSDLDVDACYDRAALLTAWLAYRLGIHVPTAIYQHHDWSGKNCPIVLRKKPNGWRNFLAKVEENYKSLKPVDAPLLKSPGKDHHDEEVPVA